jgi:hypothetical protein
MKFIGGRRKLRHGGGVLVDWVVTFTAAAYNLVRLRTLLARPGMSGGRRQQVLAVDTTVRTREQTW